MHGWCVVLALLDQELTPIAGIVYAPRLDLLLFADVGKRVLLNGAELPVLASSEPLSARSNLMVPSSIHRHLDMRGFPGKLRNIGSAALHLCFPLLYPAMFGAIQSRTTHIWDIAASDAINRACGYRLEYLGGGEIDYRRMVDGSQAQDIILVGSEERIRTLRSVVSKLEAN
jgi:myo-inositol-1(or 4)-monophosphatase